MKKRQTDNTTAQRCPSPAERGHGGRGEPFTLELSANTERASPVTEKKEPAPLRELGWYRGSTMPSSLDMGDEGVFLFYGAPRKKLYLLSLKLNKGSYKVQSKKYKKPPS